MTSIKKVVSSVLSVSILLLGLQSSLASAEIIGTGTAMPQADTIDKQALVAMLDRDEVRAQLASLGVDATQAEARINALTPAELTQLNNHMDSLPAGSSVVGVAVIVLLTLVFLDIFGVTNIFSFINPIK